MTEFMNEEGSLPWAPGSSASPFGTRDLWLEEIALTQAKRRALNVPEVEIKDFSERFMYHAEKLDVTETALSNWLNRARVPSVTSAIEKNGHKLPNYCLMELYAIRTGNHDFSAIAVEFCMAETAELALARKAKELEKTRESENLSLPSHSVEPHAKTDLMSVVTTASSEASTEIVEDSAFENGIRKGTFTDETHDGNPLNQGLCFTLARKHQFRLDRVRTARDI
ncbi:hypothetical protein TREMEDRAFT_64928 [Tremella mesenterica DSM 1558]|uniref:uncharacterized protein n=1 Tax=Tremella mesenterica (strain ATCC 24925 / CBS 8224 / DSM 1558 / NBRC 9311 / NRRL Y-6157 / RJB 2259-6 / UBC 559-6) TaxID=578456 RepID=UPI0003F48F67|nr:uncharacterized protein TREMEDRAFT_64928 [Tremella mesenterica DSM 1558]EIW67059.1 hypothetical protein TREMEDRAFT_64928 [Tremella mesenterica DSM 1558]